METPDNNPELAATLRHKTAENEKLKHQLETLESVNQDNERLKRMLQTLSKTYRDREESLLQELSQFNPENTSSQSSAKHDIAPPANGVITGDADMEGDIESDTGNFAAIELEPESTDDLQKIRGLGKALEGHLRKLGITSYKELAGLNRSDFERARDLIPNLEKRYKRENWHAQANQLHAEKYGDTQ